MAYSILRSVSHLPIFDKAIVTT